MSTTHALDPWEEALLASATPALDAPVCDGCSRRVEVRHWPLSPHCHLCARCWTVRVRGQVTQNWLGDLFEVWSTHPQRGQVRRGTIAPLGVPCGDLRPATVWQLTGARPEQDLGLFVGDFIDARSRLLELSSAADELDT